MYELISCTEQSVNTLYQSYLKNRNEFPPFEFIKEYGHNLVELKTYVSNNCISKTRYFESPDIKEDYFFLSKNKEIDQIIKILSDFSIKGRYYNLNVVVKNLLSTPNYQDEWNKKVANYYLEKLNYQ